MAGSDSVLPAWVRHGFSADREELVARLLCEGHAVAVDFGDRGCLVDCEVDARKRQRFRSEPRARIGIECIRICFLREAELWACDEKQEEAPLDEHAKKEIDARTRFWPQQRRKAR